MEYLTWQNVLFVLVASVIVSYALMTGKVIEWLKAMVYEAEKELGSGTGQLKLRKVYEMFVTTFPKFACIVPFAIFSKMVDVALEWLKIQLESNDNVAKLVTGENDG